MRVQTRLCSSFTIPEVAKHGGWAGSQIGRRRRTGERHEHPGGGVAAFKGTASCEAIYVISSLLVFFPVVPIYNMQTMRNFTRFGLKFYSVFAYTLCLCPVCDSVLCFPRFCLSFHRFWLCCLVFKVLARSRILAWILNQLSQP